jgi:hypothetical protein
MTAAILMKWKKELGIGRQPNPAIFDGEKRNG